ncbi:MAG: PD-(D/E)XK nuclease family protein, partial [Myxococcota bacterium]|nr:PD-(D/E)XK nuclease family protein [Myxococcota bacterium]
AEDPQAVVSARLQALARSRHRQLAELPIEGPLPAATVIIPDERAAHALRRELLRLGHGRLLVGTRFVSSFTLARETLAAAGVEFAGGEEDLRPLRLRALFARKPRLGYFDPEQLHAMPGWDEALARTIAEMEAGGLTPEDLLRSGHKRAADVGTLWREIDRSAGDSWSTARVMLEAAGLLGSFRPVHGPVLAAVTGHETTVHAAFLRALPRCTLVVFGARPLRDEHVARVGLLFGDEVAAALRGAQAPPAGSTDRDRLAASLFEPIEISMHAGRPATFDHSVSLEQHAGIEDEIEAAADWVAREIVEHRTPLEEIAVLLPGLDPLAGFLADRLARLPWKDGTLPVHVAGGLPATGAAAGVRILAILRALREFLPANLVAALLPWLCLDGDQPHLSASDSVQLAFALGTVGGGVSNPRGALEWKAHLAARGRRGGGGEAPREEHRAERRRRERLLRDIRAVRVSLEMLADLAGRVLDGEALRDLLAPFRTFLTERVRLPVAGDVSVQAIFLDRLEVACKAGVVGDLRGDDALGFMQAAIESLRLGTGRFGDPAVYVGTIVGAAPLPFRAVRILGLAEGQFPSAEHRDPVLPRAPSGF